MKRLLPALAALILLASCTATGTEGIRLTPAREFKPERKAARREPVILIPGTLGSRLHNIDNGEIAWGNFAATISELKDDLALPIDRPNLADNADRLRAYRVLDRAEIVLKEGSGEIRFYAQIIDYLTSALGYRAAYGRRFYRGQDLFVFFYDWRRSNVEAAGQLAEFIASIRHDLDDPGMKFTLVAVSNGGMIARYYLKYGGADVVSGQAGDLPTPTLAGVRDIKRVVCLGTPQRGTIDALNLIHDGYSPSALARRYPPATIFSMPGAFELLPEPGEKVFVGSGGENLEPDLWDPAAWETYGFSVFNASERDRLRNNIALEARPGDERAQLFAKAMDQRRAFLRLVLAHARRFRQAIDSPPEVPLDVILGVTTPTLARAGLINDDGDEWTLHFRPRVPWDRYDPMADAIFAAGDGIVTRRSGLGLFPDDTSASAVQRGAAFRAAIHTVQFTPFQHRTMFDDEVLGMALCETLSR